VLLNPGLGLLFSDAFLLFFRLLHNSSFKKEYYRTQLIYSIDSRDQCYDFKNILLKNLVKVLAFFHQTPASFAKEP
jgi:hypothetical protein